VQWGPISALVKRSDGIVASGATRIRGWPKQIGMEAIKKYMIVVNITEDIIDLNGR